MAEGNQSRRSVGAGLLNFLTLIILMGTMIVGGVLLALFVNPQLPFNPFPPPVEPVPTLGPTPTATETVQPLATASAPTATATPDPTFTPAPPTNTPVVVLPSPTPLPFALQTGSPALTENFQNELGCAWMGLAGQILGLDQDPRLDVWVRLGGELDGQPLDLLSLPGSATAYGPGGYEFKLADAPLASQGSIWVQLEDPSGNPLSPRAPIDSSDACSENLILVTWIRP